MRLPRTLGLLSLTLAGVIAVLVPAPEAEATREYAREQSKDCSHCHISDKGSGPRNARGKEFEANGHQFGVASWSSDENRDKYLRARAALLATWYGETHRLLTELESSEELPGGLALIDGTRKRYTMFARTWLRNAKALLKKGRRGLPNGLKFLTKVESQFAGTKEGKEATLLLDERAKDPKGTDAVKSARATELLRVRFLEGRTAYQIGDYPGARTLFAEVLADPLGKAFEEDVKEILAEFPEE